MSLARGAYPQEFQAMPDNVVIADFPESVFKRLDGLKLRIFYVIAPNAAHVIMVGKVVIESLL